MIDDFYEKILLINIENLRKQNILKFINVTWFQNGPNVGGNICDVILRQNPVPHNSKYELPDNILHFKKSAGKRKK